MAGKKINIRKLSPQVSLRTQQPRDKFPIVGIGASTGGLAAFEAFFSGMPINS